MCTKITTLVARLQVAVQLLVVVARHLLTASLRARPSPCGVVLSWHSPSPYSHPPPLQLRPGHLKFGYPFGPVNAPYKGFAQTRPGACMWRGRTLLHCQKVVPLSSPGSPYIMCEGTKRKWNILPVFFFLSTNSWKLVSTNCKAVVSCNKQTARVTRLKWIIEYRLSI